MGTLFAPTVAAADVPQIPGLRYLPDYVTEADEQAVAEAIDRLPWNTDWHRRRQPYGTGYGPADAAPPVPNWGRRLADRLLADGVTPVPFDHMLVNEYLPGQGIAPHRDYAPFGRVVASLSLLSPCVMDFRHTPTGRRERLLLEPRSLLVMSDEARYDWEHGIAPGNGTSGTGCRWPADGGCPSPSGSRLPRTAGDLTRRPAPTAPRIVRTRAAI